MRALQGNSTPSSGAICPTRRVVGWELCQAEVEDLVGAAPVDPFPLFIGESGLLHNAFVSGMDILWIDHPAPGSGPVGAKKYSIGPDGVNRLPQVI